MGRMSFKNQTIVINFYDQNVNEYSFFYFINKRRNNEFANPITLLNTFTFISTKITNWIIILF